MKNDDPEMMEIKDRDGARAVLDMFRALRRTVHDGTLRRRPQTQISDLWADIEGVASTDAVKQMASLALPCESPDSIRDMLLGTLIDREEYEWLLEHVPERAEEIIGWMLFDGKANDVFGILLIHRYTRIPEMRDRTERVLTEMLDRCSSELVWRIFDRCPQGETRSHIAYLLLQDDQPLEIAACIFVRTGSEFCRLLAWEQIAERCRTAAMAADETSVVAKALLHRMRGAYPAYAECIAALQTELGFLP